MQHNQEGMRMRQDYATWKRRADLLHKAQRAMQDARDVVGVLVYEGFLPGDMLRPLVASRERQDEASMWLTQAIEQHQLAGRPEDMSRQDTGRELEYIPPT